MDIVGHTELRLLRTVVQRMGQLEKESRQKGTREITPEETLEVPIEWLNFVELPEAPIGTKRSLQEPLNGFISLSC